MCKLIAFLFMSLLLMSLFICGGESLCEFYLRNIIEELIQVVIIQNFSMILEGYFVTSPSFCKRCLLFNQPRAFDLSHSSVYCDGYIG